MMFGRLTVVTAGLGLMLALGAPAVARHGEPQPGDDRGGKGNPVTVARHGEPQPGDDRGGKGNPVMVARHGEPQPGDDRGGKGNPIA